MMRRTFPLLLLIAGASLISISASAGMRLNVPAPFVLRPFAIDTPSVVDSLDEIDSLIDSAYYSFDMHGLSHKRWRRPHVFVLNEIDRSKQVPYRENPTWVDFNRVTGFYLGVASSGMSDFGPHDEFGLNASAGYGFADKRWEFLFGPEFRLPLVNFERMGRDTVRHTIFAVPTLAFGGEIHNVTSTDDAWRAGRIENSAYAFFAREDFRDYYKLAGWNAYIAFRPRRNNELRVEWRNDHYQSLSQEVFYGRWGGSKVLPPNPAVAEGEMHSLVITDIREEVHPRIRRIENFFGDPVWIEQLTGESSIVQMEFGHMPGSDFGFNRYLLDSRRFLPIAKGLSFDTRLRWEATTGDIVAADGAPLRQKLEFLGGPSTLPALYRKSLVGNRLLLFNTEVRLNLNMLSGIFHSPDLTLVVFNDFGKIGEAANGDGILKGYGFSGVSSILYNVGFGFGWTRGIQVGATWPTNVKDDPRWIFRLQRAF
ncbi:MAG: hypothetical protein Q8922_11345 [Bacteroidota bacterium]|nr:hypothetical protein [Bacteroidota bacterium]MDP4233942.1 hypothetical protein [Bacteroidota bacterium]MDP4242807.1 hypothetical protein [Bacteroidota bacterium]MDP4288521.1 hypothetical protein [Bacteroidota bacterium]